MVGVCTTLLLQILSKRVASEQGWAIVLGMKVLEIPRPMLGEYHNFLGNLSYRIMFWYTFKHTPFKLLQMSRVDLAMTKCVTSNEIQPNCMLLIQFRKIFIEGGTIKESLSNKLHTIVFGVSIISNC